MNNVIEVVIFFSSPKDLKPEKDELKKLCDRINTRLESIDCSVRYLVKEWRSIMAEYGTRPQELINNATKKYDFYFGAWWMRYGTPSGAIDPGTGIEYGSGTYEELVIAKQRATETGLIKLYLFFKDPESTSNLGELDQLRQVLELKEREQKSKINLVKEFKHTQDFINIVTDFLYGEAFLICNGRKELATEPSIETKSKITAYIHSIKQNLETYLPRQVSGINAVKTKNKFLNTNERLSLSELIYTHKRIVLLGDAGTGKSTELRQLFHQISTGSSSITPIFQTLNFYVPETGLDNFLPAFWKELSPSRLIIIWDGLDEIPPDKFSDVLKQINTFSANNPELRIVISSRTNFYETPGSGKPGSLIGFEPYYINALSRSDINSFLKMKSAQIDPNSFMVEVYDNNFDDLVTKPYFLSALQNIFSSKGTLHISRAEMFEQFLFSKIEFDKVHFRDTINIKEKFDQILPLLQKVAVTMEITCKNIIPEEYLLQIITNEQLELIKFSGIFNKLEGEDHVWQFQHNNLQEYLAAKKLSEQPFDSIIALITVSPNINRLIPSWINTLTFLFSLLKPNDELFLKLLNWLISNDPEAIIKFEKDKIPADVRLKLFKSIFNFYKKNDIWLRSNKFSERELARFAQSEDAIAFLLSELKGGNSAIIKSNAVHLLGFFNYANSKHASKVKKQFFSLIQSAGNDYQFLHSLIYNLNYSKLGNAADLKKLIKIFGKVKNQYVRGALYSLIRTLHQENEYVDYLLEGFSLVNSDFKSPEREEITLFDESWNIEECLKRINQSDSLVKVINYLNANSGHSLRTKHEVIEEVLKSAVGLFVVNSNLHESIILWFKHLVNDFHTNMIPPVLNYFKATNTLHSVFLYFNNTTLEDHKKFMALAYVATDESVKFLIDEYENRNITRANFAGFYSNMHWSSNPNLLILETYIKTKTDIEVKVNEKIDFEALHLKRAQESFDLLFLSNDLKNSIRNVFTSENKSLLSFDELYDVRRENNKVYTLEERYPNIAIETIRDFAKNNRPAQLVDVETWFNKTEHFNWFVIGKIYWYLVHTKVQVNNQQISFINTWCQNNLSVIDFKTAITQKEGGNISYKYNAIYASYFFRRFNLKFSKEVILDMLSFDIFENNAFIGITYLEDKLDKSDIDQRITHNLKAGIKPSSVLINHIKYAIKHKLTNTYTLIRKELLNPSHSVYDRRSMLHTYFEGTSDIKGIKSIFDKSDNEIKWDLVDILFKSGEFSYLIKKLHSIYTSKTDEQYRYSALKFLLQMQDIKALDIYTKQAKLKGKTFISSIPYNAIGCLNTIQALPNLLQLLKLNYTLHLDEDRFETFGSSVLSSIQNIALKNEENFHQVNRQLNLFISKNNRLKNVNYLHHTIINLEEKYFMSRVNSYNYNDVKQKLQLIAV